MRRRILALVIGVTVLVVLAFAIPLTVLIRDNAYDDGQSGLRNEAAYIARFLQGRYSAPTNAQITAELDELDRDRAASVELPGGQLLGTTPPGGRTSLPPTGQRNGGDAGGGPQPGNGGGPGNDIRTQSYRGGQLVQLPVLRFDGGQDGPGAARQFYIVRVYADDGTLRSGETSRLLLLGAAALALLVIGVLAGEVLTRRIVRPLVDTADTAQRLSAGDITARAPTSGPREVAGVGLALNRLADRIDELIADERETVADLSHRLRTPLTALRLDAEALTSPADAERIGAHVGTLERMLTSVIRAARRPQREGRIPSCDATEVVGERVAFWSALAEDQQRALDLALPDGPLIVRAADEDLAAAVDALLENVVAHTPEGTAFGVTLVATDAGARLTIADGGPGLPSDASVRGRSDRGSTGLGLDIARRCAEAAGGTMTLGSSTSGGASVALDLGRP